MMISEGFGGDLVPGQDLPTSLASVESFDSLLYPRNWDHLTYLPRVAGEIDLLDTAPADLSDGAFLTSRPVLIKEKRAVVLEAPLPVNPVWGHRSDALVPNDSGTQASVDVVAGTSVNSFLIHFDATGTVDARYEHEFSIIFPGEVVGVLIGPNELIESDVLFGKDEVVYPKTPTMRASRDAPGNPLHDELRLSNDGRTLAVKLRVSAMDQIRVLVRNTDTDRP
jgi:hypothetical protein